MWKAEKKVWVIETDIGIWLFSSFSLSPIPVSTIPVVPYFVRCYTMSFATNGIEINHWNSLAKCIGPSIHNGNG